MTYDEGKQQVILFGGQSYANIVPTDTWAWDRKDWEQLKTVQAPPPQLAYGAQLVYLPELQAVVLFNDFRQKSIGTDGNIIYTEHTEVWALTYRYLIYLPIIAGQ